MPARSAPASPSRRWRSCSASSSPCAARTRPSPAASRPRGRSSSSRGWWRGWSSGGGRRAARCERLRSRAFGPTRTRRNACARQGRDRARSRFDCMPRAIWSGAISFGLVNIPVKLYSAVSKKTVRFHQIDAESGGRVRQKRVGPDGDEIPYEQIVKGYEIGPDRYVTNSLEELASADGDVQTSDRELAMANQLIESLASDFEPEKYRDEYRERVLDLIERKAQGETIVIEEPEAEPEKVPDLMAALEASIASAKKPSKKPAKKPAKKKAAAKA